MPVHAIIRFHGETGDRGYLTVLAERQLHIEPLPPGRTVLQCKMKVHGLYVSLRILSSIYV